MRHCAHQRRAGLWQAARRKAHHPSDGLKPPRPLPVPVRWQCGGGRREERRLSSPRRRRKDAQCTATLSPAARGSPAPLSYACGEGHFGRQGGGDRRGERARGARAAAAVARCCCGSLARRCVAPLSSRGPVALVRLRRVQRHPRRGDDLRRRVADRRARAVRGAAVGEPRRGAERHPHAVEPRDRLPLRRLRAAGALLGGTPPHASRLRRGSGRRLCPRGRCSSWCAS